MLTTHERETQVYGNFPSLFMGLVAADGGWEHYGGSLRFTDSNGRIIADRIDPQDYLTVIGESVQPASYLKSPYYLPLGCPDGLYRVGPLARLNLCSHLGVPLADAELKHFKSLGQGAVTSSFLYHYARLIEILAATEFIGRALDDPDLAGPDLRADAGINSLHGVGASEAPRGTLVLLNGTLPHRSGPNLSDKPRHAYTVHVIDGQAIYLDDNWLQRPQLAMSGFSN